MTNISDLSINFFLGSRIQQSDQVFGFGIDFFLGSKLQESDQYLRFG